MTKKSVHDIIFENITNIVRTNPQDSTVDPANLGNKDQLCKILFYNHTPTHPSMRLTNLGFSILKKAYQCWACPLPENWHVLINQGNVLLKFHSRINAPYYWDNKNFYVFHSEIAFEMQMVGNDLPAWLNTF